MASSAEILLPLSSSIGCEEDLLGLCRSNKARSDNCERLKRVMILLGKKTNEAQQTDQSLSHQNQELRKRGQGSICRPSERSTACTGGYSSNGSGSAVNNCNADDDEHFRFQPRVRASHVEEGEDCDGLCPVSRGYGKMIGSAAVALRQARKQIEPVMVENVEMPLPSRRVTERPSSASALRHFKAPQIPLHTEPEAGQPGEPEAAKLEVPHAAAAPAAPAVMKPEEPDEAAELPEPKVAKPLLHVVPTPPSFAKLPRAPKPTNGARHIRRATITDNITVQVPVTPRVA